MGEFERSKDWRGLLENAERTKGDFDHVIWATAFSKLGRFRREARDITRDSRFRSLVAGLEGRIEDINFGTWGLASVVHALEFSVLGQALLFAISTMRRRG